MANGESGAELEDLSRAIEVTLSTHPQHLYEFGPYRLDTAEGLLLRNGEPVPLTPKAFETLVALVERSGPPGRDRTSDTPRIISFRKQSSR